MRVARMWDRLHLLFGRQVRSASGSDGETNLPRISHCRIRRFLTRFKVVFTFCVADFRANLPILLPRTSKSEQDLPTLQFALRGDGGACNTVHSPPAFLSLLWTTLSSEVTYCGEAMSGSLVSSSTESSGSSASRVRIDNLRQTFRWQDYKSERRGSASGNLKCGVNFSQSCDSITTNGRPFAKRTPLNEERVLREETQGIYKKWTRL